MGHLEDQESLKQLVYISLHDFCMQSWGRQPGTRSVWFSLEPVATSILCHPHTAVTRACNINCGWGFGLGGGTVNHSTSPSVCLSLCLTLSVSPPLRNIHICTFTLTCGQARSEILLKTTVITRPTLIAPHRLTCARTHTYMQPHVHAHILKAVFIWRNWKKASLVYCPVLPCNAGNLTCTYK